jgi:hypothetical protein
MIRLQRLFKHTLVSVDKSGLEIMLFGREADFDDYVRFSNRPFWVKRF